jgi:hypothetical protein
VSEPAAPSINFRRRSGHFRRPPGSPSNADILLRCREPPLRFAFAAFDPVPAVPMTEDGHDPDAQSSDDEAANC